MKRISTVLRESEAMSVRRTVCIAGAQHVVITPLTYRMCGIDMVDIYSDKIVSELDKHVRLDVIADDSQSGSIVSAIRGIAHVGKISLASCHDSQSGSIVSAIRRIAHAGKIALVSWRDRLPRSA